MAVGDGSAWDESNPTNSTLATSIDDYDRDLRVGVRSRMAHEHEWPSSQSATNEAGKHKFITLQNQATKPTVSGTQVAAVYTKTLGSGLQELYWENEAGTEIQLSQRGNVSALFITSTNVIVGTKATGTTQLPVDNTVPQITEGNAYMSLAHTPGATSNKLLVIAKGWGGFENGATPVGAALFVGTTAAALAAVPGYIPNGAGGAAAVPLDLMVLYSPNTTGEVSFSYRAGGSAAGTFTFNGVGGSGLFASSMNSCMFIYEVKA